MKNKIIDDFTKYIAYKEASISDSAYRNYYKAHKHLVEFLEKCKYTDWNEKMLNDFKRFLLQKELLPSTINTDIVLIKGYLRYSKKKFSFTKVKDLQEKDSIYLNEDEIAKMKSINLSPTDRNVLHIFLIQYYTGQRISDVMKLNPSQVRNNYWNVLNNKTLKRINIPLIGYTANAVQYMEYFNYKIPQYTISTMTTKLKKIGKLAGIDETVEVNKLKNGQLITDYLPKYKLIGTHTARRSCITNLINKGVPLNIIRKITGHSDIGTLLVYDKSGVNELSKYLEKID
jgi:integrase